MDLVPMHHFSAAIPWIVLDCDDVLKLWNCNIYVCHYESRLVSQVAVQPQNLLEYRKFPLGTLTIATQLHHPASSSQDRHTGLLPEDVLLRDDAAEALWRVASQ
jgi:hypothetical protein